MFVVVRHGNTFAAGETPLRIGARTDLPLTAEGLEQGAALGRYFAELGWQFARVLVSPLLRTRQTADAILALQTAPPMPEPCEFLREVDHGPDEAKAEDAVLARLGADALKAWDERAAVPPGWIVEPEQRIAGWQRLFAEEAGDDDPILLVTSNGAARFALLADPELQQAAAQLDTLKLRTGSYGVIARNEEGALGVEQWGIRP